MGSGQEGVPEPPVQDNNEKVDDLGAEPDPNIENPLVIDKSGGAIQPPIVEPMTDDELNLSILQIVDEIIKNVVDIAHGD